MIKVDIKYTCGCGFSTRKQSEANTHCNNKGHTLTVYGTISPKPDNETQSPKDLEDLRRKILSRG